MTIAAFLEKVREIAARELTYRTGGSGVDETCDCIGLIMGAMYNLGRSRYDLHSTNYFARYQMETLEPLNLTKLEAGMIVYKAREDAGELNARYKPGGRYYKEGDLLDYYHVGVVENADPLVIVHCTRDGTINGITRDYARKNWTHAGWLKGPSKTETEEEAPVATRAIVIANEGSTVNMRTSPGLKGELVMRVPIGATVTVLETAENELGETWSKIQNGGYTGYMMSRFLKAVADDIEAAPSPPENEDEVQVTIPKNAAEAILRALVEVLKA
ncbi:MAG: SH3 domain-containing protein [Clostridia bacterium]|nr:SH3 domain-containing protein [Clostridia bacterium]